MEVLEKRPMRVHRHVLALRRVQSEMRPTEATKRSMGVLYCSRRVAESYQTALGSMLIKLRVLR